jgi:hypothetical protein
LTIPEGITNIYNFKMEVLEDGIAVVEMEMPLSIKMKMANVISSSTATYSGGALTNLPDLTAQ